jgi:lipopolysaccharide assembly protein A
MRILHWIFRIILFLLLLGFAVKNTDPVTVHYILGVRWQAPLSLVLFFFFLAGAVLGAIAGASWLYRHRREVMELRRELRMKQALGEPPSEPSREHPLI